MIEHKNEGIHWLEFELLANNPHITHAVFLKGDNFTLGNPGTEIDKVVIRNRKTVSSLLNLEHLVTPHQCHGSDVVEITEPKNPLTKCDALMTQLQEVGLFIKHADCQAGIIYDPVNQAIANVHSGWRGSVANIYEKTIDAMKKCYGSKAENLLVCIGPSLGPQSAEFINYRNELPESFWNYQVKTHYFDFWEISKDQLKKCGVLENHIEISMMDTFEDTSQCFSHRKQSMGRHGTVVALSLFP